MSDITGSIQIPEHVRIGLQNLKDHDPTIVKRLSLHHIDILTAPLRDTITMLNKHIEELEAEKRILAGFIDDDVVDLEKLDKILMEYREERDDDRACFAQEGGLRDE